MNLNEYYSSLIGKKYTTLEDMDIIGVKVAKTCNEIESYMLVRHPGVGGPEVCDIGELPKGSVITIRDIFKNSIPAFIDTNIEFYVTTNSEAFKTYRLLIRGGIFKTYKKSDNGTHYILNSYIFEEITQ